MAQPLYGSKDEDVATHERHVSQMKKYYAKTAHKYNKWHCNASNDSSHNYAVRELLSLMQRVDARSVLDVCCGTGRAIRAMLDAGYEARGIDVSRELVEVGISESKIPAALLDVGDATALPYKDGEFDVACVFGALHHTARPRQIVSELIRVSRLGVVVSDEGNQLAGGIKSLLIALGIFEPVYRMLFRREPRQSRREKVSDGDDPTFVFSTEEIVPLVREAYPVMKYLSFYRIGNRQICSYYLPRSFARHCIVIAQKRA